jgi:hypothetical protein
MVRNGTQWYAMERNGTQWNATVQMLIILPLIISIECEAISKVITSVSFLIKEIEPELKYFLIAHSNGKSL